MSVGNNNKKKLKRAKDFLKWWNINRFRILKDCLSQGPCI